MTILHSDKLAEEIRQRVTDFNAHQLEVLGRMEKMPTLGFLPDSIQLVEFDAKGFVKNITQYLPPMTDAKGNIIGLRSVAV